MQDVFESHSSDPHARGVRLEDLLPEGRPNATLATLFAFLLDTDASDARVHALLAAVANVLPTAGRAELQGDTQRKHLAKLLLRKPAKCQHVNRMLQALEYTALPCTENVKGDKATATSGGGEGASATKRRVAQRSRRRRLMEIDAPRPRKWRLAAAWV